MERFIFLLLLFVLASACISKKKVDRIEAAYLDQLTESRTENQLLKGRLGRLTQDSFYLAGANAALLATQKNYLDRLDQLEEELDRLNFSANTTAKGKDRVIQEKEVEIRRLQNLFYQSENLLQQRLERLEQVAGACAITLIKYDTLYWEVDYQPTACLITLNENLLFRRYSTDKLLETGQNAIRDLAAVVRQFPELVVDVKGHTDNQPVARSNMDNWDYSLLRAATVTRVLTRSGLGTNQVMAAGKGEFAPKVSNETADGRAMNRRIELVLRFRESDLVRDLGRLIDQMERP